MVTSLKDARATLNAAARLILVLAVALMTFAAAASPARADVGESATGAGSVLDTYSFTFSATGGTGFSASGTMTYFIPGSFNATASVRCLLVSGNEAILVGTVTSSSSSAYVGAEMIFELVDNATPGVNADEWDFDFEKPARTCDQYLDRLPAIGGVIGAGEITIVGTMPEQLVTDLISELRAAPAGPGDSYLSKLEAIAAKFSSGQTAAACNQLDALANQIKAQRGKTLTEAQANDLLESVAAIKLKAGCA